MAGCCLLIIDNYCWNRPGNVSAIKAELFEIMQLCSVLTDAHICPHLRGKSWPAAVVATKVLSTALLSLSPRIASVCLLCLRCTWYLPVRLLSARRSSSSSIHSSAPPPPHLTVAFCFCQDALRTGQEPAGEAAIGAGRKYFKGRRVKERKPPAASYAEVVTAAPQ